MCEDSASFDLTSSDIAQCIGDVDVILKSKYDTYTQETTEGTYVRTRVGGVVGGVKCLFVYVLCLIALFVCFVVLFVICLLVLLLRR